MRKITKIFALILTVCLLVGAVAIVSSAETADSQIVELATRDFNTGTATNKENQTSYTNSSFDNVFKRGHLIDEDNSNGYVFAAVDDSKTGTMKNQNGMVIRLASKHSNFTRDISSYDYYTVEFDFASGETKDYVEGMHIGSSSGNPFFYIVSDGNDNWYCADKNTYDAATNKLPLANNGDWTHFTLIAYDAGASVDVYANGEYLTTSSVTSTGFTNIGFIAPAGITTAAAANVEFRVDNLYCAAYGTGDGTYESDGDGVFGLDDYYALGDKTLPLTFVDDIKYNSSFVFPKPNSAEVNIKGTGSENDNHYNLAAAIENLENGDTLALTEDLYIYDLLDEDIEELTVTSENGATITRLGKAKDGYNYEGGKLIKNVIYTASWKDSDGNEVLSETLGTGIKPDATKLAENLDFGIKGDYNNDSLWNISVNGGEAVVLSELEWAKLNNGATVTLTPRYGTVNWYDSDATLITTEKCFIGEVEQLTPPEFEALNNGWYEWEFASWDSEDFTIEEGEVKDYTAQKKLVSAIDTMYNYTLGSEYYASLYLPMAPENVKAVSVTRTTLNANDVVISDSVTIEEKTKVRIHNGESYTEYTRYNSDAVSPISGLYSWKCKIRFNVTFTVEIDGQTIPLDSKDIDTNIANYMTEVLDRYDCGSPEENLMLNWVLYIDKLYVAATGNNSVAQITNIYRAHFSKNKECTSPLNNAGVLDTSYLASQVPTESAADTLTYDDNLSSFGLGYLVSTNSMKLAVYADENLTVTVSFNGIKNGVRNQEISFNLTYDSGIGAYVSDSQQISMYNANAVMTISISDGEELNVSGTWTLAEYLYNISTTATENELSPVQALLAFAKASYEYTNSQAVDAVPAE